MTLPRPVCGPARPSWIRTWCSRPGTRAPRSPMTGPSGPSWSRCASSTRPATPSSWDRSGSARPSWRPRSGTSPVGAASACTSNAMTGLHKRLKAARLDASYDQEMRKLIGVDLLVIDDFALQPLDMARDRRRLRALRGATPRQGHRADVEPRPERMAGLHGRPAARPVRRRPAEERRVGVRHRRRVLPPARETNPRDGPNWGISVSPSAPTLLDTESPLRDHRHSRSKWTRRGPMLLARGWSLRTGQRH